MDSVPSWLWLTAGWLLIALGTWAALRGRIGRKRFDTPRCPRCKYSMQGAPSKTCPECGRVATGDRDLLSARPLKRWRATGVLCVAAGYGLISTPALLAGGVPRAMPGWALAYFAPCLSEPPPASVIAANTAAAMYLSLTGSMSPPATPATPPTPPPFGEQLSEEAWRRINSGEFAGLFARVYLRRVFGLHQSNVLARIITPQEWPSDDPFDPIKGELRALNSAQSRVAHWSLQRRSAKPNTATVVVTVHTTQTETLAEYDINLDQPRPRATFLTAIDTPELAARLAKLLETEVRFDKERIQVAIHGRDKSPAWDGIPYYLRFRIRVMLDGETLSEGYGGWPGNFWQVANMSWTAENWNRLYQGRDRIQVELTGDPSAAVELYEMDWTQPRNTWSGTIRVKPTIQVLESVDGHPK